MGTRQFLLDARREPVEKIFEHSRNFVFGRPKLMRLDAQRSGEAKQFKIRNPTELRFNFGEGLPAQIPTPPAAARRQHRLRQLLLVTQPADLRPNQISRILHVPVSEAER